MVDFTAVGVLDTARDFEAAPAGSCFTVLPGILPPGMMLLVMSAASGDGMWKGEREQRRETGTWVGVGVARRLMRYVTVRRLPSTVSAKKLRPRTWLKGRCGQRLRSR